MQNCNCVYEVTEEECSLGEGEDYISYGIRVMQNGEVFLLIHDVSTNLTALSNLVTDCNRLALDPIHIWDVVEDFLP